MAIVTCHTEGCGNAGIGIPVELVDAEGQPVPDPQVFCGVCGQQITDIDDGTAETGTADGTAESDTAAGGEP